MNSKSVARRRFLIGGGAALATLAAGRGSPNNQSFPTEEGHRRQRELLAYGQRSRFVKTERKVQYIYGTDKLHQGMDALTPLAQMTGIITPASLHYTSNHGNVPPDIDPAAHGLMIYGMVNRPLVLTMQDLMRLPSVSGIYFIECNANVPNRRGRTVQDTHGKIACSEWTGVPLSVLLREAGVKAGATWVLAEGAEPTKHFKSVPIAKAMEDVLVAYGQNGEPVRPHNGYPLRLVVPGFEGIYQVKWLRRIRLVDRPFLSFWEQSRFIAKNPKTRHFIYELGPKSVITFPSGEQQLPGHGSYTIRGYAWTGYGAVRRVEISIDGGRTWNDARLLEPVLRHAMTRFEYPWTWKGGEAELQSRCTDEAGNVQPSAAEFAKFWNYDLDKMHPDSTQVGHVNFIQPWRVANDGSVHNAL